MINFGNIARNMPPVTKNLIIINVIVWLAMMLFPGRIGAFMMDHCALHYYQASDFNLVQLVTYMFMHSTSSFFHLLFNMFTLFMFGISLEYVMGPKRFLLFYFVCGIGAALVQEAVWTVTLPDLVVKMLAQQNETSVVQMSNFLATHPDPVAMAENFNLFTTVGASGAIYGILLAFAMLFPNRPLYFMFIPVPIKAKWMMLIWGGMELLLGMSTASDGVAHFAHLGGMIFGFGLIWYWIKSHKVYGDRF